MTNVFVILLAILNICNSEVQILDYSHSQLISIHLEQARLQNGNFKLIHVLELTEYKRTIDDIELEIQEKVLGNSTVLPFLLYDIKQPRDALKRITPRKKRSIDILGTAWKWIAGTPDHEDHTVVVKKIKGLLGNNERQKVINKDTIDRINLLTNRTNNILRTLQSLQEVRRTIEESISNKLKIVKDEIVNRIRSTMG